MKANPGGHIDPKSAIGRDRLVENIWETIEQQSLRMTAERRIGKTTVMKKMEAEPQNDWIPVYQDLEKYHTALEFAMGVYMSIHQFLTKRGQVTRRARELFTALGGAEIGGVFALPDKKEADWKGILTRSIEDLVKEHNEGDAKLLFLWDEMPFMLSNICKRESDEVAMEVLDVLRGLRGTHGKRLRMIITGSIGLHHVFASLRAKGYRNTPVNDMPAIEIPVLETPDACKLVEELIKGEKLECPDMAEITFTIANEADNYPFYIHHIVKALKMKGEKATSENVCEIVAEHLVHEEDPWELDHYRTRIPEYYGKKNEEVVLQILDEMAVNPSPITLSDLLEHTQKIMNFDDREAMRDLLRLMERDHYLKRNPEGCYAFRFPLIKRWWKISRGL